MDNGRKWQHKFPIPLTRMTRCSIVFPRYSIPSPSFQFFHLLSLLLSHPLLNCPSFPSSGRRTSQPPVTLIPALRVPASESKLNNAFKKCFHLDGFNRILYIKAKKLENVGEFLLVVIHTLAHIHAGDFKISLSCLFFLSQKICLLWMHVG